MNNNLKIAWPFVQATIEHLKNFEESLDTDFLNEWEKYLISQIEYVIQRYKEIEATMSSINERELTLFAYIVYHLNAQTGVYNTLGIDIE